MNKIDKQINAIYDNHINEVKLVGFRKKDMDLFVIICKYFMEKNSNIITIPYSDIRRLGDYRHTDKKDFHKIIKTLDKKFYSLLVVVDDEENGYYNSKPLFKDFTADANKQELYVEINEKAVRYFNVFKQYTKIDLLIHTSLQSKYSATLYRMICQFNKNEWWRVEVGEFREIFNVPKSYDQRKITQKILEPAVEELNSYINISYDVIRDLHKRGRPVVAYKFEYSKKDLKKVIEQKVKPELKQEVVPDVASDVPESLFDQIIDLLDAAKLDIGMRSAMACANKAVELGRDMQYMQDVINIVKSQNSDNVGGKLMHLIVNGYDKPKKNTGKASKSSKFSDFMERDVSKKQLDDLEMMLLQNQR